MIKYYLDTLELNMIGETIVFAADNYEFSWFLLPSQEISSPIFILNYEDTPKQGNKKALKINLQFLIFERRKVDVATKKRLAQFGEMQGAPDWYGTPLDEIHFEWSPEEEVEIERYCEKILKNIEEEGGMTPAERFKATFENKPRDRALVYVLYGNVFGSKVLDSEANAIMPIDIYKYPKLWVKVHLAAVARFKLDFANSYGIAYGEEFYRANAMMIEYGNPVIAEDPKIKTMEDLEGIVAPDPKLDGLYPGYLWANRELRRIYDKYGLTGKMCMMPRICGDPHSIVMMYMMGYAGFAKALRKNKELAIKCLEIATEWEIAYGKAVQEAAQAESLYMCAMTGAQPPKGYEWLAEYWAKVGQALAPKSWNIYGYGYAGALQWLDILKENGALGDGTFRGGLHDYQCPFKPMIDWHRDNELTLFSMNSDKTLLDGPISKIEEEVKEIVEYGKSYNGFGIAIGMVDYWTPFANLDAAVAAAKKYGRTE